MSVSQHISAVAPVTPVEVNVEARVVATAAPDQPGPSAVPALAGPAPLFFGAARRSGTTWLAGMLNAHPEIECRNEGWMFNDFGASFPDWLDESRVRTWAERREAQGTWLRHQTVDETLRAMRRALWLAVTREAVLREGWKEWSRLRYLGDKTTTHFCVQIEQIARIFPDARFLHMLRDGRDVVVSDMFLLFKELDQRDMPEDARREAAAAREHYVFGKGPRTPLLGPAALRYLATGWATAASGGRRARDLLPTGQWHEVRYEAIAEHPVDELRALLRWLGVVNDDPLVRHLVDTHTFEQLSGGRARGQEDPTAEWRKGIRGDWKNHFTNANKELFKAIAGELLIEFGYEQDTHW